MTGADPIAPPTRVYKVFLPEQFEKFRDEGEFAGSADDQRDGYIHLSFRHQLEGTISKHFGGRADVIVAEFDSLHLGEALRVEVSRGQQLFPHLYGRLRYGDVTRYLGPAELSALVRTP